MQFIRIAGNAEGVCRGIWGFVVSLLSGVVRRWKYWRIAKTYWSYMEKSFLRMLWVEKTRNKNVLEKEAGL